MDAHILAVDDNPEIREIIEILLTGEGFVFHYTALQIALYQLYLFHDNRRI